MFGKVLRFILKTILWFIALSVLWVLVYRFVPVPYTSLMAIRSFEGGKDFSLTHKWVPLDEIAPSLQLAVVASEDQRFLSHNGFDQAAIQKAIEHNKKGKRKRGASSISQQTAKNVFLWPARSWFRKGLEAYFTFLIETFWPKERILEVYLNSIEMGNGVFGAEAASQYWFKKPAKSLSPANAAAIAAILPNPREYKANPPTKYISGRIAWIQRQMRNLGPLKFKKEPSKDK